MKKNGNMELKETKLQMRYLQEWLHQLDREKVADDRYLMRWFISVRKRQERLMKIRNRMGIHGFTG